MFIRTSLQRTLAVGLATIAFCLASSPSLVHAKDTVFSAVPDGVEAYIYGYPLVIMTGEGAFTLCLSHELLAETTGVLLRPKHQKGRRYTPDLVAQFRNDLIVAAELATDLP